MKNIVQPGKLQKGDKIRIISTAGAAKEEYVKRTGDYLTTWGLIVDYGEHVIKQYNQFAGTDAERLEDLQNAIDDPLVKAVLFSRGGYGTVRIINQVDFSKFKENPKWLIGFSDITILHSCLMNMGIKSIHGPMALSLRDIPITEPDWWKMLWQILFTEDYRLEWEASQTQVDAVAKGTLVGGNLSILYSLLGTPYEIDTTDKILFLEDVGEHLYHLDRMLHSFLLAGKLDKLKALVIGGFTDMQDNKRPFGKDIHEIITEIAGKYSYPLFFDFPAGHQHINYPFVLGDKYSIKSEAGLVSLIPSK